jgi:hypothetical protein
MLRERIIRENNNNDINAASLENRLDKRHKIAVDMKREKEKDNGDTRFRFNINMFSRARNNFFFLILF